MIEMTISIKTTFNLLLYSKALLGRMVSSFFQEFLLLADLPSPFTRNARLRWKPKTRVSQTNCVCKTAKSYKVAYIWLQQGSKEKLGFGLQTDQVSCVQPGHTTQIR